MQVDASPRMHAITMQAPYDTSLGLGPERAMAPGPANATTPVTQAIRPGVETKKSRPFMRCPPLDIEQWQLACHTTSAHRLRLRARSSSMGLQLRGCRTV